MTTVPAGSAEVEYPVRFDVDYPEQLNRVTTAFRVIWIIPIAIIVGAITPGSLTFVGNTEVIRGAAGGVGFLFLPVVLMLVFRRKYPAWWFDWNLQLNRFTARLTSYLLLLRDEYPSTDEEQAVHLQIDAPRAEELNRWLPLVKWLLAIPHLIILVFLWIAVFVVTILAWFAILFTGRYPPGLFAFVVGVGRWGYRVSAYAFLLTTDRYPPFALK
jgi:hypothetical protein